MRLAAHFKHPATGTTALPSTTVFRRELLVAARRDRLQSQRSWFAGTLLVIVLGTFAAWYYATGPIVTREMMSEVAIRSFLFMVILHAIAIFGLATRGALSIAGELDRKTLGFVLATRLSSGEIILGKLAACVTGFGSSLLAGLPVMILLHVVGGVHHRLILLAYAGIASTAILMLAISLLISSSASTGRRAVNVSVLCIATWLALPGLLNLTPLLTRIGLRQPGFLRDVNAWLLASNPVTLLPRFIGGFPSPAALYYAVGSMCALQLAARPC